MELQQRKARPENEGWWLQWACSGFIFKTHGRNTDSSQDLPPCKPNRRTWHVPTHAGLEIGVMIHPKSKCAQLPSGTAAEFILGVPISTNNLPLADPTAPRPSPRGCGGRGWHTEGARAPLLGRGWASALSSFPLEPSSARSSRPCWGQILSLASKAKTTGEKMLKEGFIPESFPPFPCTSSTPLRLLFLFFFPSCNFQL